MNQNFLMPFQQNLKDDLRVLKANTSLMKNGAMFRKDCASAYNKSKLGQKRKLKETDKRDKNGQNENSDKIKLKLTRNSLNLSNFTSMSFFCEEDDGKTKFFEFKTFHVYQKVKQIPEETKQSITASVFFHSTVKQVYPICKMM